MTGEQTLHEINAPSLSLTEWFMLAWAFCWRGIFISLGSIIVSAIAGGILGFIIGIIAGAMGIDAETIKIPLTVISGMLGFIIGLYFLTLLIKWVLKARFKKFRLALVKLDEVSS